MASPSSALHMKAFDPCKIQVLHDKMIDCHKCKHYYVTWDKNFPHGCKAMGFKSKQLPSIDVRVTSRQVCLLVENKKADEMKKS